MRLAAICLLLPLAASAQPADGAALFAQHCAACHQADGSGTVGLAPALQGEHWARLGADRGYLPMVLLHGLSGAIRVGSQNFVGSMPAFASLDDASLAVLATHLRQLQGGTEVFAAVDFEAERARPGSPPQTRQRRAQILGQ